jgi:hypothetical protein
MLYQLEKEVADLKKSVRGHKASYTKLQGRHRELERMYDSLHSVHTENLKIQGGLT